MQLPVMHVHAITSGDVTIPIDPPQMINGWCIYITYIRLDDNDVLFVLDQHV